MSSISVTPLRRSFSTQASRQRPPPSTPPPPRRPLQPPPPRSAHGAEPWLRRPPSGAPPSYPRQSYPPSRRHQAFEEDDEMSASNILTSQQIEKQQQKQRAEELRTTKARDAWIRRLHMVEDEARKRGLDRIPPRTAQMEVSDALHDTYTTYLGRLNARSKTIQQALHRFPALEAQKRKIAHFKGKRDYVKHTIEHIQRQMDENIERVRDRRARAETELHQTEEQLQKWEDDIYHRVYASHWATSFHQLALCQKELKQVEQTCRELKYSIDWRAWRAEQLDIQHHHAWSNLTQLKAVGSEHHESNALFDQIHTSSTKLVSLIRELLPTFTAEQQSEDRVELRHRTAHLLPCFHAMDGIKRQGHDWRRLNRLLQIHIRLPEAVDHQLLDEKMKFPTVAGPDAARFIWSLAQDLETLSSSRGASEKYRKRCAEIESKSRQLFMAAHGVNRVLENILQDGFWLQNPALQTALGLKKYAILLPLVNYTKVSSDFRSFLRVTTNLFNQPTQPVALQKFAERLHQCYASLLMQAREVHDSYNRLLFGIVTHCLQNPDVSCSIAWLRRQNVQLARQHETAQALARLSDHAGLLGLERTKKTSIIDPHSLLGDLSLYSRNCLPVEYVTSPLHAEHVIGQLQRCNVVGLQVLSEYILLANTQRVFIFETGGRWAGDSMSLSSPAVLRPLLEDPDIVKVTHGSEATRNHLANSDIVPTACVDIAGQARRLRHVVRRKGPHHSTEEDLLRVHSFPRHWRSIASKSMLEVLCRLAWIPAYNLITFLNAMDPETLERIPLELRQGVLEEQGKLRTKARIEDDGPLTLGPLYWSGRGTAQSGAWPLDFVKERGTLRTNPNLVDLVRAIARSETNNLSLQREQNKVLTTEALKSEETRNCLAAYYLFTSFGEDLASIHRLLSIENPARAILWVMKNLHFKLLPQDVSRLELVEPFGSVNVPEEMWKPSLTEELMKQPKKWLMNVTGKISSIMANPKADTIMDRDHAEGIPSIPQSAELGDDEVRPAFEVTRYVGGQYLMPESGTKAEVKRLHSRKDSHTARLLPAREKASMQIQRKAAAGQFARATKANTAPLKTPPTDGHYIDFRQPEGKSSMRKLQAAIQRPRRSEVNGLLDILSADDLGMSSAVSNTKKDNPKLSMSTKAKHEASARNNDIAESGSLTVEGSLRLDSQAEIEVAKAMIRAAEQRLHEASASDSQNAKLLHGTKPSTEKSSLAEKPSAASASTNSRASQRAALKAVTDAQVPDADMEKPLKARPSSEQETDGSTQLGFSSPFFSDNGPVETANMTPPRASSAVEELRKLSQTAKALSAAPISAENTESARSSPSPSPSPRDIKSVPAEQVHGQTTPHWKKVRSTSRSTNSKERKSRTSGVRRPIKIRKP
ncbi:hypothetical protein LTR70_008280 [Exophiala xenobiotica]|nr:hypothetical protein LTR70_008280 [Exophiala xenobiotica]